MASTQIADIYDPLVFNRFIQEASTVQNKFIRSGILADDPLLSQMVSNGGRIGELPGFNALTKGTPNISSDDPTSFSTPKKIASATQSFRSHDRNDSWSAMDLARQLALTDPVGAVTNSIGGFWANDVQNMCLSTLLGVLADSVATHSSDMLVTVGNDVNSAVAAAERISPAAILNTKQTMGDMADQLQVISMPSIIYTELQNQDLISYIQTSVTNVTIPMYLGYEVVVDDDLPQVAGTYRIMYTVILAARGALGSGAGNVLHPTETDRVANSGDGAGEDIIHSRRNDIIHPYGMTYTKASQAAEGAATYAELELATNWDRIWDRNNIPLAFLEVNQ